MEFELKNEVNTATYKHETKVFIRIPLKYKYEI